MEKSRWLAGGDERWRHEKSIDAWAMNKAVSIVVVVDGERVEVSCYAVLSGGNESVARQAGGMRALAWPERGFRNFAKDAS